MLYSKFFHSRFAVFFLAASISFVSAVCHASKRDREEDLSPVTDGQVKVFKSPLPIKPESQPETAYFYVPAQHDILGWDKGEYVEMRIDHEFGKPIEESKVEEQVTQTDQTSSQAEFIAGIKLLSYKTPLNRRKGLDKITILADSGYLDAQLFLGQAYDTGTVTVMNKELARHYYLKASEAGSRDADHALGLMAKMGGLTSLQLNGSFNFTVRQFFFEAYHAFLRSSMRGNYKSYSEIAYLYTCGYISAGINAADSVIKDSLTDRTPVPIPSQLDHMIAADYFIRILDLNPASFHYNAQYHPMFLNYLKSNYPLMDSHNSEKFESYCRLNKIDLPPKPTPDPSIMEQMLKHADELKAARIRSINENFNNAWNSK